MNRPCVSVIVPIYNVAPYLAQCIDSILSQSLHEIELICIDDGSTDGSSEILVHYAQQDNRVQVVHQEHQNAGIARNHGLELAQGEYVIFLDSDDFCASDLLEQTYQTALKYQADIVLFGGLRYDDKNKQFQEQQDFLHKDLLPDKPVFSRKDVPDYIFALSNPAPWTKLYSRRFLLNTGLQFQDLPNSNDVYFTLSSMALAQRITAINDSLVYYRMNRSESLQFDKHGNPLCFLSAIEALYQELIHHDLYELLQTAFRHQALSTILWNLQTVKTNTARIQILGALDTEPYCNLPLKEIPGTDDSNWMVHYYSVRLTSAQEQYRRSLRAEELTEQWTKQLQASAPFSADDSIKVSVIIPVYNSAAYLNEALASITEQTLANIEIICIDDGSADDSLDILNRWAREDNRFVILSQPNSGQGFARNIGIIHARGEYIYFMDSDDFLEKEALEQLTTNMDEHQLDSLYFDAEPYYDSSELEEKFSVYKEYYHRNHSFNDVYDGPTLMRLFSEDGAYLQSPCLQMLRTSFIKTNKLYFPVGLMHEDNAFTFDAMLHAERTSHIQHPYFHRHIRLNSTMTSGVTFQSVYGRYKGFLEMLEICRKVSTSLTTENQYAALDLISIALSRAQDDYVEMDPDYESAELGLTENLAFFRTLMGKRTRDYKNQIQDLEKWNDLLSQEPDKIHASVSYRLGRALTSPARWIRSHMKKEE